MVPTAIQRMLLAATIHNSQQGNSCLKKRDWNKPDKAIHITQLNLIERFIELPIHSYELHAVHHLMYDGINLDQLNVLTDLISKLQEVNAESISELSMNIQAKSNIPTMSTALT